LTSIDESPWGAPASVALWDFRLARSGEQSDFQNTFLANRIKKKKDKKSTACFCPRVRDISAAILSVKRVPSWKASFYHEGSADDKIDRSAFCKIFLRGICGIIPFIW
jgi:hypothetical protein